MVLDKVMYTVVSPLCEGSGVGEIVEGASVGVPVGRFVGGSVTGGTGDNVVRAGSGTYVGISVGVSVGRLVGRSEGSWVGFDVGKSVGTALGSAVGDSVGSKELGVDVGVTVGE